MASLKLIFLYLVQDMKRGPIQFKIAVITIYIIVAFMSILLNANSISISMFLGIAERQAGDTDFIITSQFANTGNQINNDTSAVSILTNLPLLNIKDVAQKLEAVEEIEGVSERWLLPGRIKNNNYTTVNLTTGAFAVIGNSLKERSIGIGRGISV